jgi:hypothetical protein
MYVFRGSFVDAVKQVGLVQAPTLPRLSTSKGVPFVLCILRTYALAQNPTSVSTSVHELLVCVESSDGMCVICSRM